MYQYLDVAPASKAMPKARQRVAKLQMVVDFTVGHESNRAVLGLERLLTPTDIDDRETPHRQPDPR